MKFGVDMQPSSFWKTILLRNFAEDCVWHAVIPTTMFSVAGCFKTIEPLIDKNDDEADAVRKAQIANYLCVKCETSLELKPYVVSIRVLIGKKYVENLSSFIYSIVVNSACICPQCATSSCYINSNTEMVNYILDKLESIGMQWRTTFESRDLSGPDIWKEVSHVFLRDHASTMRLLGKIDTKCPHCNTPNPKLRCSACNYTRYCNTTCSHSDWPIHRKACKVIKNKNAFFHTPEIHEFTDF